MKLVSGTMASIFAIAAGGTSTAALASDPLGFYVGVGAGYSTIRSDDSAYGSPGYYNDHQAAWKGIVGIRPISLIGAEAEFIDFGQPGRYRGLYDTNNSGADSHPRAGALFAVGYLPLPLPLIDVYGKVGTARLRTSVNTVVVNGVVPTIIREERTNTKFAYGAGVQSKFLFGLAVRAEYERISSHFGDPDAITVSATWTF